MGIRINPVLAGVAGVALWWGWKHENSAAVKVWTSGAGQQQKAGQLTVRVLGSTGPVVLLLHGLLAAGDYFGATYDQLAEHSTVVVPDLLGFGGSLQADGPMDAVGHLNALDGALEALGLDERPVLVVGHSLGGVLALRWAARHPERALGVLTFGAPLYDGAEGEEHLAALGRMEALLAGDGFLPRVVCRWMCRHRTAASWLATAYRPDLPVPIARSGVQHTWLSYTGAMSWLVRDPEWTGAVQALGAARTRVILADGDADPVPTRGRAHQLTGQWSTIEVRRHPTGDHGLPLTDPAWCRELIETMLPAHA